jgi:peroxin-19
LETLLSSLGNTGGEGDTEEGLQGFLETMMSQLVSKEVLYEPLKEIHEKVCQFINSVIQPISSCEQFPGYLIENERKLSQQDKDRYTEQQQTVAQIIAVFEAKDYSEEDSEAGLKVMALMNEVISSELKPKDGEAESPRNRCKNMVLRQRKSWVNSHQGWRWGRMGFLSYPGTVL